MNLYKTLSPALFTIKPECAHGLTIKAMKSGVFPRVKAVRDDALSQDVLGLRFDNPVGLAAGFDKNAEAIAPCFKLGFGFVEAGTVTPKPQDGNPKPRIFRDAPNGAVINRMGFPNGGMDAFKANVKATKREGGVLGINIGMNKTQSDPVADYSVLIAELGALADYLTINISSPNTPGLRDLQSREPLLELLAAVHKAREAHCAGTPILVKLAPDLDMAKMEELAQAAIEGSVDGLILTNTTLDRPAHLDSGFAAEAGGLSGKPLTQKSTEMVRKFYQLTKGTIPIIGVGGISSASDAYAKIKAGASLVQVYSGFIYEGPSLARDINRGLLDLLAADGYSNITEAIGVEA
ncbi:MAG: quinone-dependent dihydroorotate dehydrogenase [Alphaproteobacteria bacterium]